MLTVSKDEAARDESKPQRKGKPSRAQLLAEVAQLPDDAFVSSLHAEAIIDVSQQQLATWRYMRRGPPFVRGGRRFVRYQLGALRKFMADQMKTTVDL
jgi:hypothetical protein